MEYKNVKSSVRINFMIFQLIYVLIYVSLDNTLIYQIKYVGLVKINLGRVVHFVNKINV